MLAAQASGGTLLGLVENMAGYLCSSCWEVGPLFARQPEGENLAAELGLPFLGSIPFDPRLTRACNDGQPFVLIHPGAPSASALEKIAARISP